MLLCYNLVNIYKKLIQYDIDKSDKWYELIKKFESEYDKILKYVINMKGYKTCGTLKELMKNYIINYNNHNNNNECYAYISFNDIFLIRSSLNLFNKTLYDAEVIENIKYIPNGIKINLVVLETDNKKFNHIYEYKVSIDRDIYDISHINPLLLIKHINKIL